MSLFLLILGLVLFIGLVLIHEWGHFIMARRNGVTVEEFGLFFPPRLFKHKTKGGWLFTINALPLGGFVKLKGEHDTDTGQGTYGAASTWAKTKIMAAGVVMNLVTALVLLTILALVGMPKLIDNQFTVKTDTKTSLSEVISGYIEPNSPATKAGLKPGDKIESLSNFEACAPGQTCTYNMPNCVTQQQCANQIQVAKIKASGDLRAATKRFAGQTIYVNYTHEGTFYSRQTTLRTQSAVDASQKTTNPKGYLGIVPSDFTLRRSTWSAPVVAVGLTTQFTQLTFEGLGKVLAGVGSIIAGASTGNSQARHNGQTQASEQVSGPVEIFYILKDGSLLGFEFVLLIIAIISLTLAIMNILPFPALDGGRLWLTLITRAIGRPLRPGLEESINAAGMVVLLSLMVIITYVDIHRPH